MPRCILRSSEEGAAVAWFCNAAMHLGMSDMYVLRYAKKASCGWAPAAGMYLGHCIAWISASLLFAHQLQKFGDNASVAPGPMVYDAVGWAGLICVVIGGWTTANPTISVSYTHLTLPTNREV